MKKRYYASGFAACLLLAFLWWPQGAQQAQPVQPAAGSTRRDMPVGSEAPPAGAKDTAIPRQDSIISDRPAADKAAPANSTVAAVDGGHPAAVQREQATVTIDDTQYPKRVYEPLSTPNDPLASQWWTSSSKLDQSWDVPTGGKQTVLAIIDSGVALQHEEFAGRWANNSGETGAAASEQPSALNCADRGLPLSASCNLIDDDADGQIDDETGTAEYQNPSRLNCTAQSKPLDKSCNRVDDDGNGYIDDAAGWDFVNNDNSVQAGELNPYGTGTVHGTMVAGVAAATGNNGKGLAGADWYTRILPVQALDDDSYGDTVSVGRAIYYAISRRVDVISISLGTNAPDAYVESAVQAAAAAGITVVAAAGNDGCNCMLYPAHYPEVLAVGALDSGNQRAGFSSWGSGLDIMAPGSGMTTTTWSAAQPTSGYASNVGGTSFSAPLVAGMVTRLLSAQPDAVPLQLAAALTENTNRLGLVTGIPHDVTIGYGAIDAHKALQRMTTPRVSQNTYVFNPVSRGDYLSGRSITLYPAEKVTEHYRAYQCASGTYGTTTVYESTKPNTSFFTVSPSEQSQSSARGYAVSVFGLVCLEQPHDTVTSVRNLNIFKEFRNDYRKAPDSP